MVTTLKIPGITTTLRNLAALWEMEEEDDYGVLKPNDQAFKTAMNLILEAHTLLHDRFPQGTAATDHLGGVRLTWKNPQVGYMVRLSCPATLEQPVDIYHSTPQEYGVEDVASVSALVHWLEWLNQA